MAQGTSRLLRASVVTIVGGLSWLSALPATALALTNPSEQDKADVTAHLWQGAASTGPSCSQRCGRMWRSEQASGLEALHRELRELRSEVGLNPGLRWLEDVRLQAQESTFRVRITGASPKVLSFRVPAKSADVPGSTIQHMRGIAQGTHIGFWQSSGTAPADGFRWEWWSTSSSQWLAGRVDTNNGCGGNHPDVPSGFVRDRSVNSWCYNDADVSAGFLAQADIEAAGPIEDLSNQAYDASLASPGAPAADTVKQAAITALQSGRYPVADDWYDYVLGVVGACDPANPAVCNGAAGSIPNCVGDSFADCAARLEAAGFQTHTRLNVSESAVDFAHGPDVVLSMWPAAGSVVTTSTEIDLTTNPGDPVFGRALAARFRPNLYFDTSELFRPVSLDAFFSETSASGVPQHRICLPGEPRDCTAISDADDIPSFSSDHILDVAGAGEGSDYKSTHAGCNASGLNDCDSGANSALYYNWLDEGAYRFLDYWAFYRFNDSSGVAEGPIGDVFNPEAGFKHEGDWESVTVGVPRASPTTFDYASFSQHGHYFSYLRANLRCDGTATASCGTDLTPSGQRLAAFVAHHSHANYPRSCSRQLSFTQCWQADGSTPEAGGFDGQRPWGNNAAAASTTLIAFPQPVGGTWADWAGRWGGFDTDAEGPKSPAQQQHFSEPWTSECAAADPDCPQYAAPSSSASASSQRAPDAPTSCLDWFGPGVSYVVCDPEQIAVAFADGGLRSGHSVDVVAPAQSAETVDEVRGVSQAIGAPLALSDHIEVVARRSGSYTVCLRIADKDGSLTGICTVPMRLAAGERRLVAADRIDEPPSVTPGDATGAGAETAPRDPLPADAGAVAGAVEGIEQLAPSDVTGQADAGPATRPPALETPLGPDWITRPLGDTGSP